MKFFLLFLYIVPTFWVAGQTVSPEDTSKRQAAVIGPDDTVSIQVLSNEELSKAWRVSSAGDLSLPLIGRVHAAGLTTEQLEAKITSQLKRYMVNPQVTAFVSEFRSQPVAVTGAVTQPGVFQLEGVRTLFDMLTRAGGPSKDAGTKLTLRRDSAFGAIPYASAHSVDSGHYSVVELDSQDVLLGHGPAATIVIKPNDVISVSAVKEPKTVFVSGEVVKPGAVELVTQDHIPLTTLLAMSGGLTRGASPRHTTLLRKDANGAVKTVTRLDVGKVMSGKARDIDLGPGDIVIVPTNQFLSYLQAMSMSAATAGAYVLIGRF